jgi:hypothetical protein
VLGDPAMRPSVVMRSMLAQPAVSTVVPMARQQLRARSRLAAYRRAIASWPNIHDGVIRPSRCVR